MFGRDPTSMTHLEPLGGYEPSGYERYLRQRLASLKEFVERHRVEAQRRQKSTMIKDLKFMNVQSLQWGNQYCFRSHAWV